MPYVRVTPYGSDIFLDEFETKELVDWLGDLVDDQRHTFGNEPRLGRLYDLLVGNE